MGPEELVLFRRLLDAAKAGECPDPNCKICKEKRAAIKEAERFLEQALT